MAFVEKFLGCGDGTITIHWKLRVKLELNMNCDEVNGPHARRYILEPAKRESLLEKRVQPRIIDLPTSLSNAAGYCRLAR